MWPCIFSVSPGWTRTSRSRTWSSSKRTLWFLGAAWTASKESGQCQTTRAWLCAQAPATNAAAIPARNPAIDENLRVLMYSLRASLLENISVLEFPADGILHSFGLGAHHRVESSKTFAGRIERFCSSGLLFFYGDLGRPE